MHGQNHPKVKFGEVNQLRSLCPTKKQIHLHPNLNSFIISINPYDGLLSTSIFNSTLKRGFSISNITIDKSSQSASFICIKLVLSKLDIGLFTRKKPNVLIENANKALPNFLLFQRRGE